MDRPVLDTRQTVRKAHQHDPVSIGLTLAGTFRVVKYGVPACDRHRIGQLALAFDTDEDVPLH